MHILHILDHSLPLQSGYTFRTLSILTQQRAFGWVTSHLTSAKQGQYDGTSAPQAAEQAVDGWHFFRTAQQQRWWSRLPLLRHVGLIGGLHTRLRHLAGELAPDILHAHSPALNAIAALAVGRALGIPVVYEVRAFWEDAAADLGSGRSGGLRYRLSRALENHALRRADAITTICDGLRDDLCRRGIPQSKITVIPNAVDCAAFETPSSDAETDALRARLGLQQQSQQPVIGFIGSFYAYEGLALLLDAMPQLLEGEPALRLLLAGGGPQEAALERQAARLGIERSVIFAGRVPHGDVAAYYQLIDILVYPRLPMRLTELVTPLKPLEAMAQRRLVVASDVGGHRELIRHDQTGLLFPAGDKDALATTVLGLLRQRARWPALRDQAFEHVLHERNWQASVRRYDAIYRKLAAQQRAKGAP